MPWSEPESLEPSFEEEASPFREMPGLAPAGDSYTPFAAEEQWEFDVAPEAENWEQPMGEYGETYESTYESPVPGRRRGPEQQYSGDSQSEYDASSEYYDQSESESDQLVDTPELETESFYAQGEEGEIIKLESSYNEYEDNEIVKLETEFEDEYQVSPARGAPIKARILWPALGFPAVVKPREAGKRSEWIWRDGDATKCISVLILSNVQGGALSKEEAARYLRLVPWSQRGKRHIEKEKLGSFKETELDVRQDRKDRPFRVARSDRFGEHIRFGGNGSGENVITVNLSKRVIEFYKNAGLVHFHEIRLSEEATARLKDGKYQLFWNNEATTEDAPSDEMKLLIDKHAIPERTKLGATWTKHRDFLLKEYEFEYGWLHKPYNAAKKRAEILHPLFINREAMDPLRIGHVSDTHVDVRADVYEHNLKKKNVKVFYNNFNRSFVDVYKEAQAESHIILMTGDLIDYGRGHWGIDEADRLQENGFYHTDRNWFLFYYLLTRDDSYEKPVYTNLGNHDWRLNPYPPFAPGSTRPRELLHNWLSMTLDEQKEVVRKAHGDGHQRKFSYLSTAATTWQFFKSNIWQSLRALGNFLIQTKRLDKAGTPLETNDTSVAWYLYAINPFLDYSFTLPNTHSIVMLDWAEDEDVLFPLFERGKSEPYDIFAPAEATGPGPKAGNCITPLQKKLISEFLEGPSLCKIVGIHAPPIGPWSDWFDHDMLTGRITYKDPKKARGPLNYASRDNGKVTKWNGHPIFAFRHKDDVFGMNADSTSFAKERDWFIPAMADQKNNVRMVLAGHIHRSNIFTVSEETAKAGKAMAGRWRVWGHKEGAVSTIPRPRAGQFNPMGKFGPFFVNTTSSGPRGNDLTRQPTKDEAARGGLSLLPGWALVELKADGMVNSIRFRAMRVGTQTTRPIPELLVPASSW